MDEYSELGGLRPEISMLEDDDDGVGGALLAASVAIEVAPELAEWLQLVDSLGAGSANHECIPANAQ